MQRTHSLRRKGASDIPEGRVSKQPRPASREGVDTAAGAETDQSETSFFEGVVVLGRAHIRNRTREFFRINAKDVLYSYLVANRIGALFDKVLKSQNNGAPDPSQAAACPLSSQPGYASLVEFVRLMARRAARGWYDANDGAETT